MDSGNLALAKKMAQSIIKDGTVRDMDLFNDISGVLKSASDDPEAKSLLNRITLIKLSSASQKTSTPPPPQNAPPVEEKISPPVQPKISPPVQERVYPPVQPPVQPRVIVPPPQEKVYPPVQPKNKPPIQAKPAPVQNKAAAPVQPKAAPQAQPKAAAPKSEISTGKAPEEEKNDSIPVGLWLLAIILVLPGGIIASMMAKKKNPAKSGSLLIVGVLTSIIAAMAIFITMKYTL
ncbi:MAG: hypothetical protein WBQ62_07505 [Dehalococcoidales bacterium]|jgi:hypothetical protein